jgi:hypothetical protein
MYGMECMCGSLMYLIGTGVLKSHTSIFLSSWTSKDDTGSQRGAVNK